MCGKYRALASDCALALEAADLWRLLVFIQFPFTDLGSHWPCVATVLLSLLHCVEQEGGPLERFLTLVCGVQTGLSNPQLQGEVCFLLRDLFLKAGIKPSLKSPTKLKD